jgi:hypothetical protein
MVWTGVAAFSSCFEALEVVLPAGPVVLGDRRRGERAVCQAEQRPRPIGFQFDHDRRRSGRDGGASPSQPQVKTWVGTTVRRDVEPSDAGATVNFRHAGSHTTKRQAALRIPGVRSWSV